MPETAYVPRFLIVQQGGSSTEWYLSTAATRAEAETVIRDIHAATYDATEPFELPEAVANALADASVFSEFCEMMESLISAVARHEFSDLEPLKCPECDHCYGSDDVTCSDCGAELPQDQNDL